MTWSSDSSKLNFVPNTIFNLIPVTPNSCFSNDFCDTDYQFFREIAWSRFRSCHRNGVDLKDPGNWNNGYRSYGPSKFRNFVMLHHLMTSNLVSILSTHFSGPLSYYCCFLSWSLLSLLSTSPLHNPLKAHNIQSNYLLPLRLVTDLIEICDIPSEPSSAPR